MEQVFVVARTDFFDGRWPQGFTPIAQRQRAALLSQLAERGWFADRVRAEDEPAWKQLIPYCVVLQDRRVLCVRRHPRQSETRLHGLLSVGLGGHINPPDEATAARGPELFDEALRRELDEELVMPGLAGLRPRLVGILNDDSNPVGKVHAGLVYALATTTGSSVRIREVGKMSGQLETFGRGLPWSEPDAFETWSQILLEDLLPGLCGTSLSDSGKPAKG